VAGKGYGQAHDEPPIFLKFYDRFVSSLHIFGYNVLVILGPVLKLSSHERLDTPSRGISIVLKQALGGQGMDGKFMTIPQAMLGDRRLEPLDMVVYAALSSFADSGGEAWPSLATIARRGNVSRSTVARALPRLTKAGYIVKERRCRDGKAHAFDSTLYRLPFRRGEVVSKRDGAVSEGDVRLCPPEIQVVSERHSNYNHRTRLRGARSLRAPLTIRFGRNVGRHKR
jgi:DNA-binding transcriptional ArsR family regulator